MHKAKLFSAVKLNHHKVLKIIYVRAYINFSFTGWICVCTCYYGTLGMLQYQYKCARPELLFLCPRKRGCYLVALKMAAQAQRVGYML